MRNLLLLSLITLQILSSCKTKIHEVLIEAESFSHKGGWVVDPQFVEQMGSPYLLAHGMGTPVQNAQTEINIESTGIYFVWVRTKNWAAGEWEAPGRFRLLFNGEELESELGTGEENWSWQYAGKITIDDTVNILELKDLTGFEGRCDAIYLSTLKKEPPEAEGALSAWRKRLLAETEDPARSEIFDLVVVGGGIAGCAASVAAAEQGMKVALVHDRPVLGGNASSEIRVHTEGITWKSERILSMLNTVWWPNGSPDAALDDEKRHDLYKGI